MKKFILLILVFLSFTGVTLWDAQTDKIANVTQIIESKIDQKWDSYAQKVLNVIENYRTKYKDDSEKINLINDLEYRLIKDKKIKPVKYAVANYYTPIFYSYGLKNIFGWTGESTLKLDDNNQIDEVETIALTGSVFEIYAEIKDWDNTIYKVYNRDYDYATTNGYYIDSRFVALTWVIPETVAKILPEKQTIIERVKIIEWSQYVRWWDAPYGVSQLMDFYPPKSNVSDEIKSKWILKWVDCSWLLYYATNGYTPRNTSSLVNYGTWIEIQWLNADAIINKLEPLDLIVRRWHMILVLDKNTVIQSVYQLQLTGLNAESGVVINNSKDVLSRVMDNRTAVNNYDDLSFADVKKFVVRRWYFK